MPITNPTDLTQAVSADGSFPAVANEADLPMSEGELEFWAAPGPEGAGDLLALPPLSPVDRCPGAPSKSGESSRRGRLNPRELLGQFNTIEI